jgi:Endonuclease/Exonuclease/phosphatase family
MRIGTWNLDARWSEAHQVLLAPEHCDVWLLTEVSPEARDANAPLAEYYCHLSEGIMAPGQHYAAVLSRLPLIPLLGTHEASSAAVVDGVAYCATILPWAGCTQHPASPWVGASLQEMASPAIDQLTALLPRANTVWAGDWNQNLAGGWQNVGSGAMRTLIESAVTLLGLRVATAALPHQSGASQFTIDHIAVPSQWKVRSAVSVMAVGLSDHDAYVIEAERA